MYVIIRKAISKDFQDSLYEFVTSFGSLRKFSAKMNYSPTYVSAVINGKKPMSFKFFNKLLENGFEYIESLDLLSNFNWELLRHLKYENDSLHHAYNELNQQYEQLLESLKEKN